MNLDFVFDPTLAKRKALNFLWCFFSSPCWGHPITWAWKFDRLCYQYVRIGRALEVWVLGILEFCCFFLPQGRCFCWQSGAWRVTLPQTTLCFCWSCFGWYVIEKQKTSKTMDLCLVCGWDIFNFLTTHNVRTWWRPKRFGWTWSDAQNRSPFLEANGNAPLGWKLIVPFGIGTSFFEKVRQRTLFVSGMTRKIGCLYSAAFQPSWNQDGWPK